MPSATMRFRRERSCSVEIPGSTRWSSTKRRGPAARSRTINRVHLSPTRSSARASGDHWSYGWRFGGGTCGMEQPPGGRCVPTKFESNGPSVVIRQFAEHRGALPGEEAYLVVGGEKASVWTSLRQFQ